VGNRGELRKEVEQSCSEANIKEKAVVNPKRPVLGARRKSSNVKFNSGRGSLVLRCCVKVWTLWD